MTSKTPLRIHVAMLNSLRAIDTMGGSKLKVTKIEGQYSRAITHDRIGPSSPFLKDHLRSLSEMYSVRWSAEGQKDAVTIAEIVRSLEQDGCPELFIKSLTIVKPFTTYNDYYLENQDITVPFIFHPHAFKPSVFNRLKGRMPSFRLYARMKELRKILSADLDEETKKRWRDILLLNYPHESLSNQDIRQLWANEGCSILLRESKGDFTFMEIDESREA